MEIKDKLQEQAEAADVILTDDEMDEISKLDKGVRYYNRTDSQLVQFAAWQPQYER